MLHVEQPDVFCGSTIVAPSGPYECRSTSQLGRSCTTGSSLVFRSVNPFDADPDDSEPV